MNLILIIFLQWTSLVFAGNFSDQTINPNNVVDAPNYIAVKEDLSNIPKELHPIALSVGRLSMSCTGTHIGNGLIVTAGHCFDATEKLQKNVSCKGISIVWGYKNKNSLKGHCQKVLVMQNKPGIDYALIQVDFYPEEFVEIETKKINLSKHEFTLFSHPRSRPLQWSQYCEAEKLDPAPRDKKFIFHKCDTEPGSSGAALINVDSLKIVGLHKGGAELSDGTLNFSTDIRRTLIGDFIPSDILH